MIDKDYVHRLAAALAAVLPYAENEAASIAETGHRDCDDIATKEAELAWDKVIAAQNLLKEITDGKAPRPG